jgi:hypothetical protein
MSPLGFGHKGLNKIIHVQLAMQGPTPSSHVVVHTAAFLVRIACSSARLLSFDRYLT